jgi:hypothetical protein
MPVESATLAYAPFKNVPVGHVYIVFRLRSGDEVAISPEAAVDEGDTFSLMRGLGRTYRLRYFSMPAQTMAKKLADAGREAHTYALDLPPNELSDLYASMRARAEALEGTFEWYNTAFNSCITNVTAHLGTVRHKRLSGVTLLVSPERYCRTL